METNALTDLYNMKSVNHISGFADVAGNLDIAQLELWYADLRRSAPRRHARDKRYLEGRSGVTSSGSTSNRREEHLAVALYNASRGGSTWTLPDGRSLSLIDYQTPLKARQADAGIGKIDLFGVVDDRSPAVIELKIAGSGASMGDTPLRAVLEGLAYCAIVEANADDVAAEAAELHGLDLLSCRPVLIVMAPDDYWTAYLKHPKTGRWLTVIRDLTVGLQDALGLKVSLLALRDADFEMGLDGKPAQLIRDCRIVSVYDL